MNLPIDDALLIVRGMEVLVQRGGAVLQASRAQSEAYGGEPVLVGVFGGRSWYAASARPGIELPDELAFASARSLFAEVSVETLDIVGRALACVEFEETHRYCGRCGASTVPGHVGQGLPEPRAGERTRTCGNCGLTAHPRIPPAAIVLVERGEQMLLARSAHFPEGLFSAVAGFSEIGESLEDTVRREVREEVGVEVSELRYFGSQPWPFGRSLMVGFFATYASGTLKPDGTEIVEADWFTRDRLPRLPPKVSIARRMIDAFLRRAQ